jgi:hypothetical protein
MVAKTKKISSGSAWPQTKIRNGSIAKKKPTKATAGLKNTELMRLHVEGTAKTVLLPIIGNHPAKLHILHMKTKHGKLTKTLIKAILQAVDTFYMNDETIFLRF